MKQSRTQFLTTKLLHGVRDATAYSAQPHHGGTCSPSRWRGQFTPSTRVLL